MLRRETGCVARSLVLRCVGPAAGMGAVTTAPSSPREVRRISVCWFQKGIWRARRDSNSRPSGPQPDALSTELRAHAAVPTNGDILAEREGFEPSKPVTQLGGLANRCTRPLCDLSVGAARRNPTMASPAFGMARSGDTIFALALWRTGPAACNP